MKYHDEEWGKLVTDDKTLFEFLVLESAQAGLAWITILRKREGYKKAFYNFDVEKVAAMTSDDIDRLMLFDGIVRNRLKIASVSPQVHPRSRMPDVSSRFKRNLAVSIIIRYRFSLNRNRL